MLQGNEEGGGKKTCKFLTVGHWDCARDMKTKRKWHFAVGENMINSVMERKKIEIMK